MILAVLQTGEIGSAGAAVALRALTYGGHFTASGLAFFALLFGSGQAPLDRIRLGRWAATAAGLSLMTGLGVLTAQVGVLTGGEAFLDEEAWHLVLSSRSGAAFGLSTAGLLLVATRALGPRWTVPAAIGGVLVCASYTLLGHTTQLHPRPLLAALLLMHLLVVAFWIGSLAPLAWTVRRDGAMAVPVVERWSRVACFAVPFLAIAGLLLAWWTLGGIRPLFASWYGWALLTKLSLFAALMGVAAWHRWRLTPALSAGGSDAGRRLARSIAWEAVIAFLVLWAAAEMVSTSPGSFPHSMT